ncbi:PHOSPHOPANTOTHENOYLCYSTEINE DECARBOXYLASE SUBUNIT VHS3-LIKE ISOFORM X1 [Salix purpurea]|uniref:PHOSPHOPANTOTHENOYLCYSTEINE DECARBOXYLASE SUBUNIT VHS3-LIKE ISOFORM X1 n=1 Tax=Salix purpurea TaxID=77065 RepID=A0A9Q0UM37_SALPP|nr:PHOSPHOPANTOTHENOYLCYSTEINE DECARBOXYLASE SUBUNIT VHS3-LIKE ISOFORM X1 [Salix purpurea]
MEGLVCSNAVVVEGFLSSIIETVVLETAIAAWKAFALSLFMTGSLPNGFDDFPEESGTSQGFPFTGLHIRKKPDPDVPDKGKDGEDPLEVPEATRMRMKRMMRKKFPNHHPRRGNEAKIIFLFFFFFFYFLWLEWELRLIGSRSWEDSECLICIMGAGTDWYL